MSQFLLASAMLQDYTTIDTGFPWFFFIVGMAAVVMMIVATWTLYEKAGEPGWASLVPIYNMVVYVRIAGLEWWWVILMFIPLVNVFVGVFLSIRVAELFGKGTSFGIGMALLPWIFIPILAFSDAQPLSDPRRQ